MELLLVCYERPQRLTFRRWDEVLRPHYQAVLLDEQVVRAQTLEQCQQFRCPEVHLDPLVGLQF